MPRDHLFTGADWAYEQSKLFQPPHPFPLRFVFLDLDGVINSSRSVMARTGPMLDEVQEGDLLHLKNKDYLGYLAQYTVDTTDPVAVALINRLLDKGPCRLVLSSSHRYAMRDMDNPPAFNSDAHRALLRMYLSSMGLRWQGRLEITPNLHCERGEEVNMYMEKVLQEEDKYVILDDGRDFKAHQNLVWCDPKVGFSHQNYLECCDVLEIEESPLLY